MNRKFHRANPKDLASRSWVWSWQPEQELTKPPLCEDFPWIELALPIPLHPRLQAPLCRGVTPVWVVAQPVVFPCAGVGDWLHALQYSRYQIWFILVVNDEYVCVQVPLGVPLCRASLWSVLGYLSCCVTASALSLHCIPISTAPHLGPASFQALSAVPGGLLAGRSCCQRVCGCTCCVTLGL